METTNSSGLEDRRLIESFRAGDDESFALLVRKHTGSVYAFLYRMVQDQSVAEDLVQETFLKVWKSFARYDETKPFRTWLFAIAKNNAYDWLKKKRALPFSAFADEDEPFENEPDRELLPDELLFREETAREFDQILSKLSEKYRALLVLVYQEGFSLHEVAEILKEPYNTVKSRHQRAVRQLRVFLLEAAASEETSVS